MKVTFGAFVCCVVVGVVDVVVVVTSQAQERVEEAPGTVGDRRAHED